MIVLSSELCSRSSDRLHLEVTTHSLLTWLANACDEELLKTFVEALLNEQDAGSVLPQLLEIALTSEYPSEDHGEDIFEMAVALSCELGTALHQGKGLFQDLGRSELLSQVATYLLSVSNINSPTIRLSLLAYFGITEQDQSTPKYFNRIMGRFGHTVLDHLFTALFKKRSEGIALQFLLENLPAVLRADRHSQKIVHETFKYYMLKQPERFSLFLTSFVDSLSEPTNTERSAPDSLERTTALQHIGALYRVAAEVNHKQLGLEFLQLLSKEGQDDRAASEVIEFLAADQLMRKTFKDLVQQLQTSRDQGKRPGRGLTIRSTKRGRRPSFAKAEDLGHLKQVSYLGHINHQKAS